VKPLTRGLPLPDLRSLCPLSSTEFVELPPPPPKKIYGYATGYRARRREGGGEGCNLYAPATKLQNKHADHPTKKRTNLYRIQVLSLLNQRGWKQHIFKKKKKYCTKDVLCNVIEHIMSLVLFWCPAKELFTPMHTQSNIRSICIIQHYIRIYKYVRVCTRTGSRCTHCVHSLATGLLDTSDSKVIR
jgi:hypothetical protein